jgi:hypothetical protein
MDDRHYRNLYPDPIVPNAAWVKERRDLLGPKLGHLYTDVMQHAHPQAHDYSVYTGRSLDLHIIWSALGVFKTSFLTTTVAHLCLPFRAGQNVSMIRRSFGTDWAGTGGFAYLALRLALDLGCPEGDAYLQRAKTLLLGAKVR